MMKHPKSTEISMLVDIESKQVHFVRAARKGHLFAKVILASIVLAYCASGTAMTLVNKMVIGLFPFPNCLLAVQNMIATAFIATGSVASPKVFGQLPTMNHQTIRVWLPLVFLFLIMLLSSLLALAKVSAVTLIVIRNLISCTVAGYEYVALKTKTSARGVVALLGILAGASLFALHDVTFDFAGYAWLLVNVVATTAYQVSVKKVVTQASDSVGPFGFSFINNALSSPMLILLCVLSGEVRQLVDRANAGIPGSTVGVVVFSGVLGICISVTGFMLNQRISATALMVTNNVNKVSESCRMARGGLLSAHTQNADNHPTPQFVVILASELFVQRTLDSQTSLGVVTAIAFGFYYAQSKARKE